MDGTRVIGIWDILLILVVSIQATVLAYLREPRWKALALSFPFPCTLATLAVGQRVGIANVLGLVLLFGYTQGVRLLHRHLHVPIVYAIILLVSGYCAASALLAPILPSGEVAFYLTSALVIGSAVLLYKVLPSRQEPGYRTQLPVWIKLPIIACVIVTLVMLKNTLRGFITVFPMVAMISSYEARHSLWTIGRQIPVIMFCMCPMMVVSHALQPVVGLGPSLVLSWIVFLGILIPFTWRTSVKGAMALRVLG